MTRVSMKFVLLFLITTQLGCSLFGSKDVSGMPLDPKQKAAQEGELLRAEDELSKFHFQVATDLFRQFKEKHLDSPYFYQAQLGEAKAQEGLGRWSEAASLYRETAEGTRESQASIAAEAMYKLSYCYEALGEETKVYSSLMDADRMKDKLSEEIAKAELPARLAASLYRMGRIKESTLKLQEAEQGLQQLKTAKADTISPEWLARTYFQMGLLSTNQLSLENFEPSLDTLKIVQSFSLRSVEVQDSRWSALAAETLVSTYRDLTQLVDQVSLNRSLEQGVALRQQRETREKMAAQILEALERLRSLRVTTESESEGVKKLFTSMEPIEKKLVAALNAQPLQNERTLESQKRQR